jgi:hypothetical protein
MAAGEIILGIGGYSIIIPSKNIPNNGYRSGKLNFVKPGFTPYGKATIRGPGFRSKLFLTFDFICEETDYLALFAQHELQEATRVTGANPSLTVANGMRPFSEYGTRTRSLVPSTSVTTKADGRLEYYPVWNALITALDYKLENLTYIVTIALEETDLVPA